MTTPNVFISHRWLYADDYNSLVSKFKQYGFSYSDYSVPRHDPLDAAGVRRIKAALKEQVRQCNYFLIFANMAMGNSEWCKYEVDVASDYGKPILSVRPYGYAGNIPMFIQLAHTEGKPVGFNAPAIIRRICSRLEHPVPVGV
ncbi:MAG: nuclease [Zoogloea sp.]|nr:nuclease [Zoogloea sp.]